MSIYRTLKIYTKQKAFYFELNRNEYLRKQVSGKTVLHIGCSDFPITKQRIHDGTLLHALIQKNAQKILGIDLSEEGIAILNECGFEDVCIMNAESMKLNSKFDIILAGDVLEHLNNPGLFLEKICSLLNPGGELIVGVPSALTINNLKAWFFGWEQVHVDHTFYFSPKTLSTLCSRFNLLPTKLVFTVQSPGQYESSLFLFARRILLRFFKSMAPSIIMHFKAAHEVDNGSFIEWK